MTIRAPALALLFPGLLLGACSKPETVSGRVVDIWDRPIAGATMVLEGVPQHGISDEQGRFSLELAEGSSRLMAGKDGFIHDVAILPSPDEDGLRAPVEFQLYPDPGKVGFYAIGREAYLALPDFEAETRGTEVRAMTGLRDVGDVQVPGNSTLRFVFSSTLRAERLAQLNLQLHRLEFVGDGSMPGVLGETPVALNLWSATGEAIPFDLVVLPSRDDFLIELREPLAEGAYAFHTQGSLTNTRYEGLDKLPKELRRSWAFEVK
jgi:hypothetical protein